MSFRVGATLGGWSRELRSYVADHAPDMDVVLVRDQRGASDPQLSVICLDLSTVWVTQPFVDSLRTGGVTVVGVFVEDAEQQRWVEWGVPHRLRADVAADAMVYLLETLRSRHPAAAMPADVEQGGGTLEDGVGRLIAIGGPSGSGAREVAIAVVDRFAGTGSTVLVDCDETGGTVAGRIGYSQHPNLLAAVPVAATGSDLARVLTGPTPGRPRLPFDVIGGLPSGAEWDRVSPAGVVTLLHACRQRWRSTVAVMGPVVEDLRRWVDRYGVSLEIGATAPTVIGVCAASPKGVLAFAEWLGDSRPSVVVQVVVNKVPAGSAFVRGEVFDRLRSLCGDRIELVGALPWDRRVVRAEWDAALVRRGPYFKAVGRAVALLAVDPAGERVVA